MKDLFDGITNVGYGQWTFPKNKPYAPFLIGCMYILIFPLMGGLFILSSVPAFYLQELIIPDENKSMLFFVFFYLLIYIPIYLYVNYKLSKNEEKRRRKLKTPKRANLNEIRAAKTKILIDNGAQVVDVRTTQEFDSGHLEGSINIPLNDIENNIDKIKSLNKDIVVVCASGIRSRKAIDILSNKGISINNGGSWLDLN